MPYIKAKRAYNRKHIFKVAYLRTARTKTQSPSPGLKKSFSHIFLFVINTEQSLKDWLSRMGLYKRKLANWRRHVSRVTGNLKNLSLRRPP